MFAGRLSAPLNKGVVDRETLGLLMGGSAAAVPEVADAVRA
jgi:hypothetical protein